MNKIEESTPCKYSNSSPNKVGSSALRSFYYKNYAFARGTIIYPPVNNPGWITGPGNKPGIIAHEDIPI